MTTGMDSAKRKRGRPPGSGRDDAGILRKLAEYLLDNPATKPMTAIKKVCVRPSESDIRRVYNKWCKQRDDLKSAELERRRFKEPPGATNRRRAGADYWLSGRAGRELENQPFFRALHDLQHSPALQRVRDLEKAMHDAQNTPLAQAMRDHLNSPLAQAVWEMQNSPLAQAVRDHMNSPLAQAVRAMQDTTLARSVREFEKNCDLLYGANRRSAA